MRVELAYGRGRMPVELPDALTTVIQPQYLPGLPPETVDATLRESLRQPIDRPPLRTLVGPTDRAVILVCDITRAIPTRRILPPLLDELHAGGLTAGNILILVATGTHRANSQAELRSMLGDAVVDNYRVVNHDATDLSAHSFVGTTRRGRSVWVDTRLLQATVRILTGFIEPHFFAGFSAGPKLAVPGVAAMQTVMAMHDGELIAHPRSRWGITDGNPLWDELNEAARLALETPAPDGRPAVVFNLNVTLNRDQEITKVFAGELRASHGAGCEFGRSVAMQGVDALFDIVITTNSGYPLDLNLYQTVKGMSAAAQVVRQGGSILVASECIEGFPDHGKYRWLLRQGSTTEELLERIRQPGFSCPDQWEVQIQAQIQRRAEVYLKTAGLESSSVREAHLIPIDSVERTVKELLDRQGGLGSICVLPEGPQTIPYLRE